MMPEYRHHFFIFILPGFIQTKMIPIRFYINPGSEQKEKG